MFAKLFELVCFHIVKAAERGGWEPRKAKPVVPEPAQEKPKPLLTVTQANLRNAGSEVEDPAWLSKQFGVDMGKIDPGAAPFTGEFGDAQTWAEVDTGEVAR